MVHGVALLLGVWLASAQTVVWLGPREPAHLDTQALLAAVAVYTRDLQVLVRPAAEPVTANSAVEGRAALSREPDARLGFWCEVQPTQKVVTLTIVDDKGRLEIHLVEIKSANQAELHRAIALKLRAAIATSIAETAPSPSAAPPPAPDAAATTAAVPAVPSIMASPERPAAPSERRFFLALGYRFSAPTGTAPLRHAAAAEAVVRAGPRVEIGLGTELGLPGEERASAGSVSLFDLPIRAAARWLWPRPRFTFAVGPFVAAHLLWASADAVDGGTAESFSATAGAGAEALVRVRLSNLLGGELRAFAETPIPTTRYWVREVPTLELGPRVGLAVGLVFPGP